MEKILIIDDEAFIRENVQRILAEDGYTVLAAAQGSEAVTLVGDGEVDLALLDLNLGQEDGLEVLRQLKALDPELLVIIITGFGSVESAVDAIKLGAFHYMKKPFKADALRLIVKLALQTQSLRRGVRTLQRQDLELFEKVPLVGASAALQGIIRQMRDVARHPDATVLITGESGTGKELVARGVHHLSARNNAPFISINCASVPLSLLESELFGHEKGAFTGASQRKPGLFEEADRGTIFLDEIGEMDVAIQAKLLRVLEERQIRRVGGTASIPIDVRVVAATNRNLQESIQSGRFREDLYYRLNVFPLHIPPLRERREDIPLLAGYFLEKYSRALSRGFQGIAPGAMARLERYAWPGNIRELKNVMERICIMHHGPQLLEEHLPTELGSGSVTTVPLPPLAETGLELAVEQYERSLIEQALRETAGNVLQAAQLLRLPRGTLRYKMAKYQLG